MDAMPISPVASEVPDLLGVLRARKAQESPAESAYGACMARDTMRYWIVEAAKAARLEAERKPIHIAVQFDGDQSTVWRFENHKNFGNIDLMVAAYAADLECDPIDIWELGIKKWRESGSQANVTELKDRRQTKRAAAQEPPLEVELSGALPPPDDDAPSRTTGRPKTATGRPRAKRPA